MSVVSKNPSFTKYSLPVKSITTVIIFFYKKQTLILNKICNTSARFITDYNYCE